ncbi:MAG: carboxypeptidase-like regulatory domain-containing protein, partial [candidate division Zixibacteria bacterium]|nr:carboxypeptidase-like regulatory domain-containing protein [candidate division Zixibacteria bacterium]
MKLKCLTLTLLMLCLLAGTAMSATVGRITGVITDSQTKEPLVGVSVQIIGTTMGAMTNENGQYSILNVPTGTYTLRLTAVGFATVEISNVEVSADLATYQNETMSSQATDIG